MKFLVMRPHQGDKWYRDGDIREARESEVAHLVRGGVLRKMDEPPANKARYVLEDKAAPLADGPTGPEKPAQSSPAARVRKPRRSKKSGASAKS